MSTAATGIEGVSAVVCNYNGENYLPECLAALQALAEAPDEIIVVDNASTDASLEVVRRDFPGVRIVETGSNAGPARARNIGMRAARHRWVLAVDNDAVVRPNLLARLKRARAAHPGAVILQPRSVFHHEPQRVHYDGGAFHYAGLIALRNWYQPIAQAAGDGVLEVGVAISVCLLLDRDVVLELGGYDERYFILFEDLDLSYRLRSAGYAIVSDEEAIVLHNAGTPGVSFREGSHYPASRIFYHSRNRALYLLKCYRLRTLIFALPGLCAYELVWFGFACARGGLFAWLRGKWQVLRSMGETLRLRRAVQRRRQRTDGELLVGGPLTVTPALEEGRFAGALIRALDGFLRAAWKLARGLGA